uniref:Cyclin N-terminal domain-containing protein n=1 Tax=Panagrolaimus sp. ES5 TaxID=591445 RepID=A0AC34G8V6_9BILA
MMDIKKDKLQLFIATCLYLVAKYEEVSLPHITDFVYYADSSFTQRDIMAMERKESLIAVNFNMGFAYPIFFFIRYRYVLPSSSMAMVHNLTKFYLDMFMSIYELAHKLPSVMAQ